MGLTFTEKTAVWFIASIMVFPQSYVILKLVLLTNFLLFNALQFAIGKKITIHVRVLLFYIFVASMGLFWAIVGHINGGELTGIIMNLRLYVLWSGAFCVIYHLLLLGNAFQIFHKSIVAAGILISAINLFALFNHVGQFGLVPIDVITELDMFIGVHDGYVQITSMNIGSLFLIVAYLVAIQFRVDADLLNNKAAKLSLFLCIVLTILSGRRALWLAISAVPILIVLLTIMTNSVQQLRGQKRVIVFVVGGTIPALLVLSFLFSGQPSSNSTVLHLQDAFTATDERTVQIQYLIDGFKEYPIFGSGFGVSASYIRSDTSNWLYELTYFQMLFNFGVVGILLFCFLITTYLLHALKFISQHNSYSGIAFSLLIGVGAISIGAYSNPYLRSFDFLFLLGIFPLISAHLSSKLNSPSICAKGVA